MLYWQIETKYFDDESEVHRCLPNYRRQNSMLSKEKK